MRDYLMSDTVRFLLVTVLMAKVNFLLQLITTFNIRNEYLITHTL